MEGTRNEGSKGTLCEQSSLGTIALEVTCKEGSKGKEASLGTTALQDAARKEPTAHHHWAQLQWSDLSAPGKLPKGYAAMKGPAAGKYPKEQAAMRAPEQAVGKLLKG